MKRILTAALLAVAVTAVSEQGAQANGFGPGYFNFGINFSGQWGRGTPGCPPPGAYCPPTMYSAAPYGYPAPAPAPYDVPGYGAPAHAAAQPAYGAPGAAPAYGAPGATAAYGAYTGQYGYGAAPSYAGYGYPAGYGSSAGYGGYTPVSYYPPQGYGY